MISTTFRRYAAIVVMAACVATQPVGHAQAVIAAQGAGAASAARPNIVLILADDLDVRLDTLDYTPHIGSLLQQEGMTFRQALVPVSLCCPSRVSLLRGQYVHNHAVYSNGPPDGGFQQALDLHLEDATFATVLHDAGYRTALMGKYLNGYPLPTDLTYIPPGWDEFYSPSSDAAYFGFNYTMNMNGVLVPFGNTPQDYMTDVLARTAVSFVNRASAGGAPFFMQVSTYAPHGPATPAPRHAALFPDLKAPRTPSFNELDNSDKPPLISSLPLLTPADVDEIDEQYRNRVRSMQAVDEMVAAIVAALQHNGVLDNTYIVFTSDNGYHMGQHRFPAGKYTNYEEDLRVPFIVRGPGVPANRTSDALVSTTDLAPTFAEIAHAPVPAYVDGRSLLGLLGGATAPWRKVFFLEQYPFSSQFGDASLRNGLLEPDDPDQTWRAMQVPSPCDATTTPPPIYTGLRGERFKYVEHHACDREIYDLQNDPYELNNLYGQAGSALRAELDAWLKLMFTCAADSCRTFELGPQDVTPPQIGVPPDQTVPQTTPAGAVVVYPAPSVIEFGSGVAASGCLPASGSVFGPGTTVVTCSATDVAGNSASATFTVTVQTPGATAVKLNVSVSPGSGRSGVSVVALTGSGFPVGPIAPSDVAVDLAPTCQGTPVATTAPAGVTALVGTSRRLSVRIPAGLPPGAYWASLRGFGSGGVYFASATCSALVVLP